MKYIVRESHLNEVTGKIRNFTPIPYDHLYDALQYAMFRMRQASRSDLELSHWEHVPTSVDKVILSAFALNDDKEEALYVTVVVED